MQYIREHIRTILKTYEGSLPLSHFLKEYFRKFPKLGSRDRKMLSQMAYAWYRCSKGFQEEDGLDQEVLNALILTGAAGAVKRFLPEEWANREEMEVEERIERLEEDGVSFNLTDLAPFNFTLSDGVTEEAWLSSMLQQPDLFIRIRKGQENVLKKLDDQKAAYMRVNEQCIALPNGTPIDKLLPAESYWVQDVSSQHTSSYFHPKSGETWWDSCAGAGGKSLMLKDREPEVKLTVSDKRESILHNLKERFRLYFNNAPASFIADLTNAVGLKGTLGNKQFDNIICDAPCTGSGTWARTPEQLYFFREEQIEEYASRQRKIVDNLPQYLKPGGRLIYITCSVFQEENEMVVEHLLKQPEMELLETELINGTQRKADSMFIAVFRKRD
jgi:16S rRNA (cytosine967-C5)-methyltransferase